MFWTLRSDQGNSQEETCCIYWLQNPWNNLPEYRRLNSFEDGRQKKESSSLKSELNWFDEENKVWNKATKTVRMLKASSKPETSLWKTFKAESQLIRVQRENVNVLSGLCSGASEQTNCSVSCLLKGGAAERQRQPSPTGLDAGGFSVLCVWLRLPVCFSALWVENGSAMCRRHSQILQLEIFTDDLPDQKSGSSLIKQNKNEFAQ